MALTAGQIREAWRAALELDRALGGSFSKPDLAAAVQAADAWCDTNATSYNAALPLPFRTGASAGQKAILLAVVAMKRTGVL